MPLLSVLSAKLPQTLLNYYRPQTKFAKVMFLHLSVSHSVHSGGLQTHTQGGSWGVLLGGLQAHTQRERLGRLAGGISRPTPRGVSRPTPRGSPGLHLGGSLQVQAQGVCLSACCDRPPPPPSAHSYCCMRYASYWNAFMFYRVFHNTHRIR